MFERCVYFNTNKLARRVNKLWNEAYAELGLAPAHAYLLRLVLAHPGISQKAIADELGLDKSTVTRFVDKMEAEHYLERQLNPEQKSPKIRATLKAKKIEKQLNLIGDRLYQKMQKLLAAEDLKHLTSLQREAESKIR